MRWHLADFELRALECVAEAALGMGRSELPAAERSGRSLVRLAPYRENGYAVLMRALATAGNRAEAVTTYELLRIRLRDDLGVTPSPAIRDFHHELLVESS